MEYYAHFVALKLVLGEYLHYAYQAYSSSTKFRHVTKSKYEDGIPSSIAPTTKGRKIWENLKIKFYGTKNGKYHISLE